MQLQPPRGTRDLLPEKSILLEEVLEKVREVFRACGFDPLETPAFENLEILEKKCGEDMKRQIFRVGHAGTGGEKEKLGLRFDLTVPLARIAASDPSIPKPFRRYHVSRVWRHEEPQKGRFREFYQADIDTVGSASIESDAEVIACAVDALNAIGIKPARIRINDRRILDAIVKKLGEKVDEFALFRALDKLDKIGERGVALELKKLGMNESGIDRIKKYIHAQGTNEEKLKLIEKEFGRELVTGIHSLLSLLHEAGVKAEVDLSMARGLDYYTGTIFEINAGSEAGAIAAGGRYDNLIELYGGRATPAVGISLGIERILEILAHKNKKTLTKVFVASVSEEYAKKAREVAVLLRKNGIATQTDVMGRNLKKQFDYVNALSIPHVVIIGKKEAESNRLTLRDMKGGTEQQLSFDEVVKELG